MVHHEVGLKRLIASLPLFKGLKTEAFESIAARARTIDVMRGTLLFKCGDPCGGFHAVLYGRVKLALPGRDGSEKVLDLIGPAETFGEAVMFLGKPHRVSAQALEDTKLMFVPREAVFAGIDADPRFATRLLASLSARVDRLVLDIEAYSLRSGTERVVRYLLASVQCARGGTASGKFCVAKRVIASRLNLTQEHFSRVLHELTAAGLIAVEGRDIWITDVERLRCLF